MGYSTTLLLAVEVARYSLQCGRRYGIVLVGGVKSMGVLNVGAAASSASAWDLR